MMMPRWWYYYKHGKKEAKSAGKQVDEEWSELKGKVKAWDLPDAIARLEKEGLALPCSL